MAGAQGGVFLLILFAGSSFFFTWLQQGSKSSGDGGEVSKSFVFVFHPGGVGSPTFCCFVFGFSLSRRFSCLSFLFSLFFLSRAFACDVMELTR